MKRACLCGLLFLTVGSTLFGQTPTNYRRLEQRQRRAGHRKRLVGLDLRHRPRRHHAAWQASDFSGNNLPTTLDGVSVLIDGKKAAISYVSPGQLNVQAPTDTATGPVPVQVTNSSGTATGTATLQNYSPAFFTFQAKYAAAVHNSDGVYVAPAGSFGSAVTSRPAQPGETLQIYATGFGPTTPAVPAGQLVGSAAPLSDLTQLQVTIGGVAATVQFAGIVAAGEYQINVIGPASAERRSADSGNHRRCEFPDGGLNSDLEPGGRARHGDAYARRQHHPLRRHSGSHRQGGQHHRLGGDLAGQRTSGRQLHRRDHLGRGRLHRARRSAEPRGGNRDRRQPRRPHGQGQRDRESAEPSAGGHVGDSQPGESRQCDHHG